MERPWRAKSTNHNIGRSKPHAPCRKHPKHRQSPGVCSICLNERLSHIINLTDSKSSARSPPSSSSSSSYASSLSSSDVSSCSSPVTCRAGSEGRRPVRAFGKSRSLAFVARRGDGEGDEFGRRIKGRVLVEVAAEKKWEIDAFKDYGDGKSRYGSGSLVGSVYLR